MAKLLPPSLPPSSVCYFLEKKKPILGFRFLQLNPLPLHNLSQLMTLPQKTIILNNHSEELVGFLHDTGSKEVVILCHGFQSSKENQIMVNLSLALAKEGISAFRFDFPGNGESDGSITYGFMREVDDLSSVVKHFKGAQRIVTAIVGHSKGGDDVLLYPSKYGDVNIVVNISGRYDLKKGIPQQLGEEDFMETIKKDGYIDVKPKKPEFREFRVTEGDLMDRLNTNMHEACLRIDKDCRVLTIHGSADKVVPAEDAYAFSKIISNHKLHIIKGANHGYTSTKHQAELVRVTVDFIKAHQPTPT